MDDFRVKFGFLRHPKTDKLKRLVGADGVLAFLQLWEFCAMTAGRRDGRLDGLTDDEIEHAAGWHGEPGALVAALHQCRFVDGSPGSFERQIHQFNEHNAWVARGDKRTTAGRTGGIASGKSRAKAADSNGLKKSFEAPSLPSPSLPSPSLPVDRVLGQRSSYGSGQRASVTEPVTSLARVRLEPKPKDGIVTPESKAVLAAFLHAYPGAAIVADLPTSHAIVAERIAEGYSVQDLEAAIIGNRADKWACDKNLHRPSDIFNPRHVQKYMMAGKKEIALLKDPFGDHG